MTWSFYTVAVHNASGADLSKEQWNELANLMKERGLIPFVDFAYQGFGDGIEEDSYAAKLMAEKIARSSNCQFLLEKFCDVS